MADVRFDGADARAVAALCGVPHVELLDETTSTQDVAHALAAAGAAPGTLVLSNAQTAGRGRAGKVWASTAGAGIWLTLVERPADSAALGVLALRIGLALAPALDPFAITPVRLKWPNDLWVGDRKLGGVLAEARWRDGSVEWVAIGVGINVRAPDGLGDATGLRAGTARLEALRAVVPAVRAAVAQRGDLTGAELTAYGVRDLAAGRRIVEPVAGTVLGIAQDGALSVETAAGPARYHSGSLVFAARETAP